MQGSSQTSTEVPSPVTPKRLGMTTFIVKATGISRRQTGRAQGRLFLAGIARRAIGAAVVLVAAGGCLDDTPMGAGTPNVRATLHANLVGAVAGGTVRIRVGYRTSREPFVPLPSTPGQVSVPAGTTAIVPVTVDIRRCLADAGRVSANQRGCRLRIELTLTDAGGGVIDTQTRDAPGEPTTPGVSVDFGTITVGVTVSAVTIAPASLRLVVTQEQDVAATARDATGAVVTSVPVTWTTSDATVAQLSSSTGATITIRALKIGSATVAANAGGKISNQVAVTVISTEPLTIRQRQGGGCVIIGQTINLEVDSPPGPVSWTSMSPDSATVGAATGVVTGIMPGHVEVTATSGGRTGRTTICVIGSLRVLPSSLSITAGRTGQLSASGETGGALSYASSAPAIATVDATGLVRGLTVGQAVITTTLSASSGTQSVTTPVTVTAGSVSITPTSGSAALTRTARFTAVVRDANGATLPGVSAAWTIDDASVGSLSGTSGVAVDVQALAIGATTVRATAGGASSSATFTAMQPLPASRLEKVSGDGIACPTHSTSCSFVVRAVDATGSPVGGAAISWTGSIGCPAGPNTTSDANGLSTAANVCSAVAPGTYHQSATLLTNQFAAQFTYSLRGIAMTSSFAGSSSIAVDITSATATAEGLAASVRYRTGPIGNYFTSLQLNRTFTPAVLTMFLGFANLPPGSYTFEVTVTTTTPGLGPGIQTFGFEVSAGSFVQPRIQRLDDVIGSVKQMTSSPPPP